MKVARKVMMNVTRAVTIMMRQMSIGVTRMDMQGRGTISDGAATAAKVRACRAGCMHRR